MSVDLATAGTEKSAYNKAIEPMNETLTVFFMSAILDDHHGRDEMQEMALEVP